MTRFMIRASFPFVLVPAMAWAQGLNVTAGYQGTSLYDVGSGAGPVQDAGQFTGPGWDIQTAGVADFGLLGASVSGVRDHPWTADPSADSAFSKALNDDRIIFGSGSGTFKVIMDFDGLLEVNGARFTTAAVRLSLRHGSFLETVLLREKQLLYNDPNGQLLVYDEQLVSDPIPFSSGGNGVRLVGDLLTQIQLDGFSNESMAARSDFLSTARIAYLEVRDPSGNLIDVSAVGGSGHVYPVNIPEPGCLVGLALAACLWVRRRPVSARHARAA